MLSRVAHRMGRDDDGFLAVVVAVAAVVVLVSVALVYGVRGDFSNTNYETNLIQARALAQSGIADALFQIDQQGTTPVTFCNAPSTVGTCSYTSVPGASGVVYTARYAAGSGTYTVYSRGTSHGVSYAVKATVSQNPVVTNALFTATLLTFNGNSTSTLAVTDQYGNPITGSTGQIAIGQGGTMTCHGPSDPNATYVSYSGTISGCSNPQSVVTSYGPQDPQQTCPSSPNPLVSPPTPCMPNLTTGSPAGPTQSCTAMTKTDATHTGTVTGSDATGYTITGPALIEPGYYSCRGGLTVTGTVDLDYTTSANSGVVDIFVFPPVGSSTSPNVNLSAAQLNVCQTVGATSATPCKGGIVGDPSKLRIYASGSGTASVGGGRVDAILWAPSMSFTMNGSSNNLMWTGALILGSVTVNGSPNFTLNFDQRVESEYTQTNWGVTNYIQTSPTFSVP